MDSFTELVETIPLDSVIDGEYFTALVSDLLGRPVSAWTDLSPAPVQRVMRLGEPYESIYREVLDLALPDKLTHLYLVIYPDSPGEPMAATLHRRMALKPYSDAVRYVGEPYKIDFKTVLNCFDEAVRDQTPVTVISATRDYKKIIYKMVAEDHGYLLPAGSRWFHVALPVDVPQSLDYSLSSLAAQITGIPPDSVASIYGGAQFPSWCWQPVGQKGYRMPPWMDAVEVDGEIVVCDLAFQGFPVVRTGHRGAVDGRFVHLAAASP